MSKITNRMLIDEAISVIRPVKIGDFMVGDVGAALLTENNNIYRGVCIDVGSSMGFCAEHNAIGAMVTAGEYRIKKIVAVWQSEKGNSILSPCGRCREFIRQIQSGNLETDVILDIDRTVKLAELLPDHDWCQAIK